MIQLDEIVLNIDDIKIRMIRKSTLAVPHEVTVVIPRAEFRHKYYDNGRLIEEEETILNSITIVHSPQRPPTEQAISGEKNNRTGETKKSGPPRQETGASPAWKLSYG